MKSSCTAFELSSRPFYICPFIFHRRHGIMKLLVLKLLCCSLAFYVDTGEGVLETEMLGSYLVRTNRALVHEYSASVKIESDRQPIAIQGVS